MSELAFVELNERVYKYIRQFTIKSSEDALVELITNCIDAYNKGNITPRKIFITYNAGILKVVDNAIGLSGVDMERCFLQVGDYTNVDSSRGFFSRGAKDISAIGDITFETIKNGLYSRVFLNSDAYGRVEVNEASVTQEQRTQLNIPNNGLSVTIKLLSNFSNFNITQQKSSLSKLAVLRDIMTDQQNIITYNGDKLSYSYPDSTTLLELSYTVPNYPDATAYFNIYKANSMIPQPYKENELEFGFLIKDSATVYEVGTVDDRFRWDPYMPYIFGYIKCDRIGQLLREYDKFGPTGLNPMPIIDPSRLSGVNKEHPFIISLLSIPKVRVDQVLRDLNTSISSKSISLAEMNDLFNELEKYGLNFIESEDVKMKFVPTYDRELAKAIEDDRMKFVTSEVNYMLNANYSMQQTETDKYIMEKIKVNDPNVLYVMDENDVLIPVPSNVQQDTTKLVDMIYQMDPNVQSNMLQRPYVYSLDKSGNLVKLYIFEKGRLERVTNPEEDYVIVKEKKLKIEFINDINIEQRYVITTDNGITIKLNIHNSMIKKYLATDNVKNEVTDLSVSNITSVKSLIFLKDLMIEILAEIITENDIINNRLQLDSNSFGNMKKILTHRNKIVNRVEDPLEAIFDKFINENLEKKTTSINTILDSISSLVGSKIDLATEGQDIVQLKQQLDTNLTKVIE